MKLHLEMLEYFDIYGCFYAQIKLLLNISLSSELAMPHFIPRKTNIDPSSYFEDSQSNFVME